jgi:hypothetical protein
MSKIDIFMEEAKWEREEAEDAAKKRWEAV